MNPLTLEIVKILKNSDDFYQRLELEVSLKKEVRSVKIGF